MRLSGQTIEMHDSFFTLDAAEDQSLAEKDSVICIELRKQDWTPHEGQPMVRMWAITAVPSERQQGAFRRIGFATYYRARIDLPKSEIVIV